MPISKAAPRVNLETLHTPNTRPPVDDCPTIVMGRGDIYIGPISSPDRTLCGIEFRQLTNALDVGQRVGDPNGTQPFLRILSTRPASLNALCDVVDQAIKSFNPAYAAGEVVRTEGYADALDDLAKREIREVLLRLIDTCDGASPADTTVDAFLALCRDKFGARPI